MIIRRNYESDRQEKKQVIVLIICLFLAVLLGISLIIYIRTIEKILWDTGYPSMDWIFQNCLSRRRQKNSRRIRENERCL